MLNVDVFMKYLDRKGYKMGKNLEELENELDEAEAAQAPAEIVSEIEAEIAAVSGSGLSPLEYTPAGAGLPPAY
jgi:hypothetical protein